jgi:hypothetical protein
VATGRPSDYTQAIADEICERLIDGESLRSILHSEHLPSKKTIYSWLMHNPEFLNQYTQAREIQADTFVDEMTDIADDGTNDYMEKVLQSGEITHVADHEHINRSRLRIDTRKWVAERMRPKKYFKPDDSTEEQKPEPLTLVFQVKQPVSDVLITKGKAKTNA